jgi:hypothetical protein
MCIVLNTAREEIQCRVLTARNRGPYIRPHLGPGLNLRGQEEV